MQKHLYKLEIVNLFNQIQTYYINVSSTTSFDFNVNNNQFKSKLSALKLKTNFKLNLLSQKQANLLSKNVNNYQ